MSVEAKQLCTISKKMVMLIYSTNSPTFSLLDPHKKITPLKRPSYIHPENYTQQNNTLKTNCPDLLVNIFSPYSLKSNGPD
jgi:hypothetical protein